MSKAKYWYTPLSEGEGNTALKMKQVLMADIKLEETSENISHRGDAIKKEKN